MLLFLEIFKLSPCFQDSYKDLQFSSVVQLCLTLCDPRECSKPGFPIRHQLMELTQTHVHWVSDAIQSSDPLLPLLLPSVFPRGSFLVGQFFTSGGQRFGVSASTSVLPMYIQNWSFRWTGWSQRDSQESSLTPQFKSINSLALSFLYSPTLTFKHDYWKIHSFD